MIKSQLKKQVLNLNWIYLGSNFAGFTSLEIIQLEATDVIISQSNIQMYIKVKTLVFNPKSPK